MKKEKILQKSEDFSNIISTGQKQKNKYFSLYYKKSNESHYGITVPKKIGHAVIRNKLKRQTREILDNLTGNRKELSSDCTPRSREEVLLSEIEKNTRITGSGNSYTIWVGSKLEYDSINVKDDMTLYFIKGD